MRTIGQGTRAIYTRHSCQLTWAWRIIRRDGFEHRFISHDQYVNRRSEAFYNPQPGIRTYAARHEQGLQDGSTQLAGLFEQGGSTLPGVPFALVHAGYLDGATCVQYLINWEFPWAGQPVVEHVYDVADVSYDDTEWSLDLVGLTGRTKQKRGAIYSKQCLNELGVNDGIHSFCQKNITPYPFTVVAGTVLASPTRRKFQVQKTGGQGFNSTTHTANWFAHGRVEGVVGLNANLKEVIESSEVISTDTQELTLQAPLPFDVQANDTFTVVVGCDKQPETCRLKFAVFGSSFRGAPDIPGFDLVLRTPSGS